MNTYVLSIIFNSGKDDTLVLLPSRGTTTSLKIGSVGPDSVNVILPIAIASPALADAYVPDLIESDTPVLYQGQPFGEGFESLSAALKQALSASGILGKLELGTDFIVIEWSPTPAAPIASSPKNPASPKLPSTITGPKSGIPLNGTPAHPVQNPGGTRVSQSLVEHFALMATAHQDDPKFPGTPAVAKTYLMPLDSSGMLPVMLGLWMEHDSILSGPMLPADGEHETIMGLPDQACPMLADLEGDNLVELLDTEAATRIREAIQDAAGIMVDKCDLDANLSQALGTPVYTVTCYDAKGTTPQQSSAPQTPLPQARPNNLTKLSLPNVVNGSTNPTSLANPGTPAEPDTFPAGRATQSFNEHIVMALAPTGDVTGMGDVRGIFPDDCVILFPLGNSGVTPLAMNPFETATGLVELINPEALRFDVHPRPLPATIFASGNPGAVDLDGNTFSFDPGSIDLPIRDIFKNAYGIEIDRCGIDRGLTAQYGTPVFIITCFNATGTATPTPPAPKQTQAPTAPVQASPVQATPTLPAQLPAIIKATGFMPRTGQPAFPDKGFGLPGARASQTFTEMVAVMSSRAVPASMLPAGVPSFGIVFLAPLCGSGISPIMLGMLDTKSNALKLQHPSPINQDAGAAAIPTAASRPGNGSHQDQNGKAFCFQTASAEKPIGDAIRQCIGIAMDTCTLDPAATQALGTPVFKVVCYDAKDAGMMGTLPVSGGGQPAAPKNLKVPLPTQTGAGNMQTVAAATGPKVSAFEMNWSLMKAPSPNGSRIEVLVLAPANDPTGCFPSFVVADLDPSTGEATLDIRKTPMVPGIALQPATWPKTFEDMNSGSVDRDRLAYEMTEFFEPHVAQEYELGADKAASAASGAEIFTAGFGTAAPSRNVQLGGGATSGPVKNSTLPEDAELPDAKTAVNDIAAMAAKNPALAAKLGGEFGAAVKQEMPKVEAPKSTGFFGGGWS